MRVGLVLAAVAFWVLLAALALQFRKGLFPAGIPLGSLGPLARIASGNRAVEGGLALVGLFALAALALRLAIVVAVGFNPDSFDADSYHYFALFGLRAEPIPSHYHPPGYSWFLAKIYLVAGPRPRVVYAVQAVLSAVTVFLCGDAARRRFGTAAGVLAAALLAVDASLALFPSILVSETLAGAGVALVAWLLLPRWPEVPLRGLVAVAALAGVLGLVRTGLVLLAVPALLLALGRLVKSTRPPARRSREVLLATAVVLLSIVPIVGDALLESRKTGVFRVGATSDTYNLWAGNNPLATGRNENFPGAPRAGSPEFPTEESRTRYLAPKVREFILHHPFRQLDLVPRRASYLLAPAKRDLVYLYGQGWAGERPPTTVLGVYAWAALSIPVLGSFAILGFAKRGSDPSVLAALLLLALGALPYLVSIGDARYVQPFHVALAFVGAAVLAPRSPRDWASGLRIPAAVAALLFLANAAYDVKATGPALAAIARPGGSTLRPSYVLAR